MDQRLRDFFGRHETPLVFAIAFAVFVAFLFALFIGPWLVAGE